MRVFVPFGASVAELGNPGRLPGVVGAEPRRDPVEVVGDRGAVLAPDQSGGLGDFPAGDGAEHGGDLEQVEDDVDVAASVGTPISPSNLVHVDGCEPRAGAVAGKSFHVGPGEVEVVSEVYSSVDDIACSPDQVSPLCLDKIMVRCPGPFVEDNARSSCLVLARFPEIPAWLECQAMGARESVREILLQRRQVPQVLCGVCEAEQ